MQIVLFTIIALVVYVVSDGIVKAIDKNREEPLQNQTLIFFIVFFALILISFQALRYFLPAA